MTKSRTTKRSRSGADAACPHCGKKLRGAKGLKAHLASAHGATPPTLDQIRAGHGDAYVEMVRGAQS